MGLLFSGDSPFFYEKNGGENRFMIHNKIFFSEFYIWDAGSEKWDITFSCSADILDESYFSRTVCRTYSDYFRCFFSRDGIDPAGN